MQQYRTNSPLNLRRGPSIDEAIVRLLPAVHPVAVVGTPSSDPAWREVSVDLEGDSLHGFVNSKYLKKVLVVDYELPSAFYPTKAGRQVLRTAKDWARSLNDDAAPKFAEITPLSRRILSIADWAGVDVRANLRWWRAPSPSRDTYCNVYAHDVAHLAGHYVPRVWWEDEALALFANGEPVDATKTANYREMRANHLFEWLADFGPHFGWEPTSDLEALQSASNQNRMAIISATTRTSASGHITVVLPERDGEMAERDASSGKVVAPRQSQAGRDNKRSFAGVWWKSTKYPAWSGWIR